MKKLLIAVGVFLFGLGMVHAQEEMVMEADPIEEKVMVEGASMEAFLEEEFPTGDAMPIEEEEEVIEEPEVILDPADRGVVPEIELYGMDDEVVTEDDAVLFRFSDEGAPLAEDDEKEVQTALTAPKCEDGEGFLFHVKRFFKSLFGKCKK